MDVNYPFGEAFQMKLLGLLLYEPEKSAHIIEPAFFTDPILVDICKVMRGIFDRHPGDHIRLSKATLKELVHTSLGRKDENWMMYRRAIRKLYKTKLRDRAVIFDEAMEFARELKYRDALVQAEKDVSAKKYDKVKKRIEDADAFGRDFNIGLEYWKGPYDESRWRDSRFNIVPTGFKKLDRVMKGLGAGELGIGLAAGKGGKSRLLANLAANALLKSKNVALATGEVSDLKYRQRIDSLITGVPSERMEHFPDDVKKRLKYFRRLMHGNLWIKQFPTGKGTSKDIEVWMDELQEKEIEIDLLIVDYLMVFMPHTKFKDRRLNIGQLAVELRGIAVERQIPVWTVNQSTRSSYNKDRLGPEDFAEDISQFWTLDYLLALVQSKRDMEDPIYDKDGKTALPQKGRLYLASARDTASGFADKIHIFPATYKMTEFDWEDRKEEYVEKHKHKHKHHKEEKVERKDKSSD